MTTTGAALDPARGTAATVDEAMVSRPKTWPASTTVGEAEAAFTDHVHLLLLVEDDRLLGTLTRDDLERGATQGPGAVAAVDPGRPALDLARLEGRAVRTGTPLEQAREQLERVGVRRVAVVDADARLLGLLCLKRHRGGYCSDAGVAARAAARPVPGPAARD